jgi:hypothetical protein
MAVKADYNNTSVYTIGAKKIETPSYQGFQADVSEITRISAVRFVTRGIHSLV